MVPLTIVGHGYPGAGKTTLVGTSSGLGPMVILDADNGSRFLKLRKVKWDPREAPPVVGDWDAAVVIVREFDDFSRTHQWLNTGDHPFESGHIDTLTMGQKRCLEKIVGVGQPDIQAWGSLLRYSEDLVRKFCDLTTHPTHPLKLVSFMCHTSEKGEEARLTPHVQGQLTVTLPGFVDVVGYLFTEEVGDGRLRRKLLTAPWGNKVAKDRTDVFGLGVSEPNLTEMWGQLQEA